MTDRSTKLLKEARDAVLAEYHTLEPRLMVDKINEIIVRECTELTLDYVDDSYYRGWNDYRDLIRRHFGLDNDHIL